jgi:hypothetical protein
VFPRSVGSGMFAFDWIWPSIHSHRTLARFTSAPLMPVLENDEQPGGSEDNTTLAPVGSRSSIVLVAGPHAALPSEALGRLSMLQPQIGLSAGGPSTLGSFRVKMRFGLGLFMPSNSWSTSGPMTARTLREMVRHTNDQNDHPPRSRSRFRKRLFRVTTCLSRRSFELTIVGFAAPLLLWPRHDPLVPSSPDAVLPISFCFGCSPYAWNISGFSWRGHWYWFRC